KHLCIGLEREPIGLTVLHQDYTLFYPFFKFYDNEKQRYFHLVENHSSINQTANLTNGLFAGDFLNKEKIVCLIPEHKKVDYFLKIRCENVDFSEKKLLLTLKNISQIVLAYPVNTKELKSINNLIFE
ncbi:MAG: IPExxxVDY family protein, partial [Flavobacteriaceae bacterium]|nr:IPExxxVDY family protein [Flavobacteriaceae bacterium]